MKQFAIIGLGNFGFYLATRLSEKGHDVLAMDRVPARVQAIKDLVRHAVVADATDRDTLAAYDMKDMDATVVCIGSNMTASILTTMNLKDLGVEKVLVKAISEQHGRIMEKLGASEVIFPERDAAVSLSERLHNPNIIDYLPFIEGYSIVELPALESFRGKALKELDLINRMGVQVVAIKENTRKKLNLIPTANYVFQGDELLILLGPNESLEKMRKRIQ